MAPEGEPWMGKQERNIIRAQENQTNMGTIALGYAALADQVFSTSSARSIRLDVDKHRTAITNAEGMQQVEELQKLLRDLKAYKNIFAGVDDSPSHKEGFALALVKSEKGKQ